jgi:hypothetical protein
VAVAALTWATGGNPLVLTGCAAPAPPRISVPADARGNPDVTREREPVKPLPTQPTASFDLSNASQQPIEPRPLDVPQFLDAYDAVGRPRLLVVVYRSADPAIRSQRVDYDAMETDLARWLSAGGAVAIVPTAAAHELITDEQLKNLQSNVAQTRQDLGRQLRADVLVGVAVLASPLENGSGIKLLARAMNTGDGATIGEASVETIPPLDRRQVSDYTRTLAQRMLDEMARTWQSLPPPGAPSGARPSATNPAPATPTAPSAPKPPVAPSTPPAAPAAPAVISPPVPAPAPNPPPPAPAPAPPTSSAAPAAPAAPAPPAAPAAPGNAPESTSP